MSTKYSLEQIRSTLYSGLICDVLDQMGYHHQYLGCEMDALLPDTVVFGKAFTAVATQVYSMPSDPLTAQCRVLDQMQPGEVFVLTTRGEYSCAILGELMATAIKSKGGTGAILDGMARDLKAVREMILADDEAGRRVALAKLLPIQRGDFEGLFKVMKGYPVTVRLLDPPLHEFVPHFEKEQRELAKEMGVPFEKIAAKVEELSEVNPMLGHRGCRLGNTYPEITEMQTRAIIEAAMNVRAAGIPVHVEIMVPLVGNHKELRYQKNIIDTTAEQVFSERNDKIDYMVGTMIEVPRAAVTANQIAEVAEFFSFGTNDLTQMTLGFSRDDIGKFLPVYLEKGILKNDPFQILDRNGVGQLIREAVFKGRGTRENLKCGICGEHGGEPSSVEFCHYAGLNYVSCSPFRVPIARLAAAHAALNQK
mgnify:CR=1 FL=1